MSRGNTARSCDKRVRPTVPTWADHSAKGDSRSAFPRRAPEVRTMPDDPSPAAAGAFERGPYLAGARVPGDDVRHPPPELTYFQA